MIIIARIIPLFVCSVQAREHFPPVYSKSQQVSFIKKMIRMLLKLMMMVMMMMMVVMMVMKKNTMMITGMIE